MNLNNSQLIHIGAEVVVIGGVTYWLNGKIGKNTEIITILAQEIDGLKQVIRNQSYYINQLLKGTNIPPPPTHQKHDGGGDEDGDITPPSPPSRSKPPPENVLQQNQTSREKRREPPAPEPRGMKPAVPIPTLSPYCEEDLVDELKEELAELEADKGHDCNDRICPISDIDPDDVVIFDDIGDMLEEEEDDPQGMIEYPVSIETLNTDLNLPKSQTNKPLPQRPQRPQRRRHAKRS